MPAAAVVLGAATLRPGNSRRPAHPTERARGRQLKKNETMKETMGLFIGMPDRTQQENCVSCCCVRFCPFPAQPSNARGSLALSPFASRPSKWRSSDRKH